MRIEPDTKDWTWVLDRPCSDCGFDAADVPVDRLPALLRDDVPTWEAVLALPDAAARPAPGVWSPLEYACHVRDVHRMFDRRVALMLDLDEPRFENWDQDETAAEERYAEQDPAVVATELRAAAEAVAARYEGVTGAAWERRGTRDNGSEFTVASIGRYHLHDVVHHAWDVRAAVARATVAAYDADAATYRAGAPGVDEDLLAVVDAFVAALPSGARVLEIGSGPGRDARLLEERGVGVRRTDVSASFVELLRADGHAADVLDPLTDDLTDPERPGTAYDGVWANASLLHVARADLPAVLRRLADVTAAGGVLRLSVKEGDGEGWSRHGHVAGARRFTYWRAGPLGEVLEGSGWAVRSLERHHGSLRGEPWLEVVAHRR